MRFRHPTLTFAIAALVVGVTAGCTGTLSGQTRNTIFRPPSPSIDPVIDLLSYAASLRHASPEHRATAVETAHHDVVDTPGARAYARLALAYGTPQQKRYAPDEAARYASLALDADDADWSKAARQYLYDYTRLYKALTQAPSETRNSVTDESTQQRISALQIQLAEARRKLRAMADIEDHLKTDNP